MEQFLKLLVKALNEIVLIKIHLYFFVPLVPILKRLGWGDCFLLYRANLRVYFQQPLHYFSFLCSLSIQGI